MHFTNTADATTGSVLAFRPLLQLRSLGAYFPSVHCLYCMHSCLRTFLASAAAVAFFTYFLAFVATLHALRWMETTLTVTTSFPERSKFD